MALSFMGLDKPFALIDMVRKEEDTGNEWEAGKARTVEGKREIQRIMIHNKWRKQKHEEKEGVK